MLLPGGKRVGREWRVGGVEGDSGKSLSVCLSGEKRGVWADFATGEGGDLIDLWASVRRLTLSAALKEVRDYLGIKPEPKLHAVRREYTRPEKPSGVSKPQPPVVAWLNARGITDKTIAEFKIASKGEHVAVFPYLRDGEFVNAKYRDIRDKSKMRQEKDAEPCLFGWHLIDPNARAVAITEGECFPAGAQVLTPVGWCDLSRYQGGMVAQYSGGQIEWVHPLARVERHYRGDLVRHEVKGYVSMTTPGHNMVSIDGAGRAYKHRADDGPRAKSHLIPRVGLLDGPGIALSDAELRLAVAVSADASIDVRKMVYGTGPSRRDCASRYVRFGFSKARKVERLRSVLVELGINPSDTVMADGKRSICFGLPDCVPGRVLPWSWIAEASARQRELLLEEIVHWDGNLVPDRNQHEYSTKIRENAEWVQALAHTAGRVSSIIERSNEFGGWFKVSILHGKRTSSWQSMRTERVAHDGMVYCVQVPSGAIVVRQEGRISISGNCDAMTIHQLGFPALSVNAGAGNHQWIESDWDRLERFSDIVLCYDNDAAGQKGAREVSARLGADRCRICVFPSKDANQYLQDGGDDHLQRISDAQPIVPEELLSVAALEDEILRDLAGLNEAAGVPLVIGAGEHDWLRFRGGEVTLWTGHGGHGKSQVLGFLALGLIATRGEKWCFFSGEMRAAKLVSRMVRQASCGPEPTLAFAKHAIKGMGGKLWVYNVQGSADSRSMFEVFEFAARRYGVGHFVIDSLMMLSDVPEEGSAALEKQRLFMGAVAAFANKHNVHVHVVAHPRKAMDESKAPGKQDVAGSGKIAFMSHNIVSVWARLFDESKMGDEDEYDPTIPDAKIELQKQRNGETQHRTLWMWFDPRSQQYCSNNRRTPTNFFSDFRQPDYLNDAR